MHSVCCFPYIKRAHHKPIPAYHSSRRYFTKETNRQHDPSHDYMERPSLSRKAYLSSMGKPTPPRWESLPLLRGKAYLSFMKADQKPHKSGQMES